MSSESSPALPNWITTALPCRSLRRPCGQVIGTLLDTPVRRRGDAAGAVSIADIGGAVCIDAAHVFVVGLNEGVLPASTADDLLLGRDLPDAAASRHRGATRAGLAAERAWNALLHSDAAVTATLARTDLRRGGEVYPSPLLAGIPIEQHRVACRGLLDGEVLTTSERLGQGRRFAPRLAPPRPARQCACAPVSIRSPTEFDGVVGQPSGVRACRQGRGRSARSRARRDAASATSASTFSESARRRTRRRSSRSSPPSGAFWCTPCSRKWRRSGWVSTPTDGRRGCGPITLPAMHLRAIEVLDELAESIGTRPSPRPRQRMERRACAHRASIVAALDAEASEAIQPVACEHAFTGVMVGSARSAERSIAST